MRNKIPRYRTLITQSFFLTILKAITGAFSFWFQSFLKGDSAPVFRIWIPPCQLLFALKDPDLKLLIIDLDPDSAA